MKKIIASILIFTSISFLLTSCSGFTNNTENTSQNETWGNSENATQIEYVDTNGYLEKDDVFVVGVEALPYSDEELFKQLFNLKNHIDIDIDISDEELAKLQADYEEYEKKGSKSPIYREASMNITIGTTKDTYTYHIPNVGVRMKGNTSRTSFYNDYEGQYNLIHLRVKFMDGDFAALENLEMKWNRNDDSTYVRELYAYDMYRDMGILAPHVNLASTDFGGVHQGVFSIYEPVDKNFIEKNVAEEDQDGDLYKCGWTRVGANLTTACTIGIEDEEQGKFYNYDLKNNKKTSNHELMKNLIAVLNKSNVKMEELEEVVDMENFLKFAAVSYFVGNPDDIRNDYNNYYIYFLKSSGKAVFIPYDCDRVFGVTESWNPTGDGMTGVNPFSTMAEGARNEQQNPLFRLTVNEGGYYVDDYTLQLKLVSASQWLTTAKFNEYYSLASGNYAGDTTPDKTFYNAENHDFSFDLNKSDGLNTDRGNASFEEYVTAILKSFYEYLEK